MSSSEVQIGKSVKFVEEPGRTDCGISFRVRCLCRYGVVTLDIGRPTL